MHVPVWTVKLMENMLELALLPSCLLVFLLPPPVLTARSCLALVLPEMFDAFQAKMVMVKLKKAAGNLLSAGAQRPACGASL